MITDNGVRPESILRALGVFDATAVTRVMGGSATSIWRIERPAGPCALRVFRPGQEDVWRREIAAMEAAGAAGVPVPHLYEAAIWHDRPAMLLGWCPGVPLGDLLSTKPQLVWRLSRAFGRAQAAIHRVAPPPSWNLADDAWIATVGSGEQELQKRLQLDQRAPPTLLHLDYHLQNVLGDARCVTAVLDWANAHPGDPRADVARTFTILTVEPWHPVPQSRWMSIQRRILAALWRAGYEAAAGPLGDLSLYYAWAGAVMVRDLAWRVADPASWWQPKHLAHIRRWTEQQKRRAGIST